MEQSILKSTKKVLHLSEDDESFDLDVLTHINGAFSTLHDLGVGPQAGFTIEDDTKVWEDFLPDEDDPVQINRTKQFVFVSVRLIFDPPTMPHVLTAYQNTLAELTWRLSVKREETDWVDPMPPDSDPIEVGVIDGGDPSGG